MGILKKNKNYIFFLIWTCYKPILRLISRASYQLKRLKIQTVPSLIRPYTAKEYEIVKDNKIYELFMLICSILFSIMFMQHTFNSFYDLATTIWIHYAYNNYIYILVPCFLLGWPPFWCTSGHANKATFQLQLHYINLIIQSLQIHSGTKVNFSFIWLHQTFKWIF